MKDIIEKLKIKKETISTMESCTGGSFVNEITNIEGASEVLKFSAITYSNEFKIKMGVDDALIKEYSVYSIEVARDMALKISSFSKSDYGIGITGQLKRFDSNNISNKDNVVYISIYSKKENKYYDIEIIVNKETRKENKEFIILEIIKKLKEII